MICLKCRHAGELNKQYNRQPTATLKRRVMAWHSKCPGNTHCTCQHVTGQVINNTERN
jgi:hypothetical protein